MSGPSEADRGLPDVPRGDSRGAVDERPSDRRRLRRRAFLATAGGAALALAGRPALATAGSNPAETARSASPGTNDDATTSDRSPASEGDGSTSTGSATERWRFRTGDSIHGGVTVVDGTAHVGSHDGSVYALDADTGEQQWRCRLDVPVEGAPTVVDGAAYVTTLDGDCVAIDPDTGEVVWQTSIGGIVHEGPTVAGGSVYALDREGAVASLDAATGSVEWRRDLGRDLLGSPTVVDAAGPYGSRSERPRTCYLITVNGRVIALDAATGEETWQTALEDSGGATEFVVAAGRAIGGAFDGSVVALDAASGGELWRRSLPGDAVVEPPTVVLDSAGASDAGTVYVGAVGGGLFALDLATGEPRWQFDALSASASPTVANGVVVTHEVGSTLYGVDAATQQFRWQYDAGSRVGVAPTVVDGTCFAGCDDGSVVAVDTGVDGSGSGARAELGVRGHHGDWIRADESVRLRTAADAADDEGNVDGNGTGAGAGEPSAERPNDDLVPGFGVPAALTALVGCGHLLRSRARRHDGE